MNAFPRLRLFARVELEPRHRPQRANLRRITTQEFFPISRFLQIMPLNLAIIDGRV
jgi:hypothetical protein